MGIQSEKLLDGETGRVVISLLFLHLLLNFADLNSEVVNVLQSEEMDRGEDR
jgi:hypothetical protein